MCKITKVFKGVTDYLHPNKVFMFSKVYCPYCDMTKELFNNYKIQFDYIEVDSVEWNQEHKNELYRLSKIRTYPNIFLGLKSIGGYDQLSRLEDNEKLFSILDELNVEYQK